MDGVTVEVLQSAASRLKGAQRRSFLAEVCNSLCEGNPRLAESRFGWGRATVAKGIAEAKLVAAGSPLPPSNHHGKKRSEDANPQLAIDIRAICDPRSHSDPELKTSRTYTNMTAREVREELLKRGHQSDTLPSERTLRDILNRMNYRLKKIQKGKPLKKTENTDAIFANVKSVRAEAAVDPETLEISIDTKTKVKLGEYSGGGKNANRL